MADSTLLLSGPYVLEGFLTFVDCLNMKSKRPSDPAGRQQFTAFCVCGIFNTVANFPFRDDVQELFTKNTQKIFEGLATSILDYGAGETQEAEVYRKRATLFFRLIGMLRLEVPFWTEVERNGAVFKKLVLIWFKLGKHLDSEQATEFADILTQAFHRRTANTKDLDIFGEAADGKLDEVAELVLSHLARERKTTGDVDYKALSLHLFFLHIFSSNKRHPMVLALLKKGAIPLVCKIYRLASKGPFKSGTDERYHVCDTCNAFLHDTMEADEGIPWITQAVENGYFEALAGHSRGFAYGRKEVIDIFRHPIKSVFPLYMVYPAIVTGIGRSLDAIAKEDPGLQASLLEGPIGEEWRAFLTLALERLVFKAQYDYQQKTMGVQMMCSGVSDNSFNKRQLGCFDCAWLLN